MTWTIYNNDKAWGFLSRAEQRAICDHNGVLIEYDYAYGVWRVIDHHAIPRDKKLYRAASERKPAVDADQTAQLDIANARIAELEAANVTARADALRKVERITADRDQGMLDYCALMERYDAAIQNPTTEDVK
jgi:hypothetical protein